MAKTRRKPRCIIIAGPNGAGKTTFARDYLPEIARLIHFVNADLIAGGISPLRPELAAIAAGRLVLRELNRLVEARVEFAFESTLSGLHYAKRLEEWKHRGYLIEIVYIRLDSTRLDSTRLDSTRLASPKLALSRIASRVKQGGRTIGQYMKIPNLNRDCWSADHDHST